MSMAFWFKMHENYMQSREIKAMKKLPSGYEAITTYIELLCVSLKHEGVIELKGIGNSPYEELALLVDEDDKIIQLTLSYCINLKLIKEVWNIHHTAIIAYIFEEVKSLIGKKGTVTEKELFLLKAPKTSTIRMKQSRAKKWCEEHNMPMISNQENRILYNGYYYVRLKTDKGTCQYCGNNNPNDLTVVILKQPILSENDLLTLCKNHNDNLLNSEGVTQVLQDVTQVLQNERHTLLQKRNTPKRQKALESSMITKEKACDENVTGVTHVTKVLQPVTQVLHDVTQVLHEKSEKSTNFEQKNVIENAQNTDEHWAESTLLEQVFDDNKNLLYKDRDRERNNISYSAKNVSEKDKATIMRYFTEYFGEPSKHELAKLEVLYTYGAEIAVPALMTAYQNGKYVAYALGVAKNLKDSGQFDGI